MILVILILFFDLIFLSKIVLKKTFESKILIFFLIFNLVILALSYISPYGLYKVSDYVYAYYLTFITLFSLFFVIAANKKKSVKIDKKRLLEKIYNFTNKKYVKFVVSILTLILLYYYFKYLKFSQNIIDKGTLRAMYFSSFFTNYTENLFYNNIVCSINDIVIVLGAIILMTNTKKNYFFFCSMLCLIFSTLIGSSRMSIYFFILYCLTAFLYFNDTNYKNIFAKFKSMYKFIIIFILMFGISLYTLAVRTGREDFILDLINLINEQVESLVIYFTGGFRALEIYLENGFSSVGNFTIFRATFAGLEEIISIFILILGINYNSFNTLVGKITQTNIYIGNGLQFNAFYTCIMNFYNDLGFLGIIIYSIIWGITTLIIIRNTYKENSVFSTVLMIYFVVNIIFSSVYRWNLQSMSITCSIIVMLIARHYENKQISNKKRRK